MTGGAGGGGKQVLRMSHTSPVPSGMYYSEYSGCLSTYGLRHPSGGIMQPSGKKCVPQGGIISIDPLGGVQ